VEVPSSIADTVVRDFVQKFLKPTNTIDLDSVVGIGSTRKK
jgi:hypothetical protein